VQNSKLNTVVLAKQLRNARIESGLTQKEVGEIIGISRQAITRIESGNQNVTIETLQKFACALDYSITIELSQKK